MILAILAYIITSFIFVIISSKKKEKFYSFPHLKINKSGIVFCSYLRHRIKHHNAKIIQIGTIVYMRKNNSLVTIKNIDRIKIDASYLYFYSLGKCFVGFDASRVYRYFNLKIISDKIDLEKIKKITLESVLNSVFSLKNCKKLIIYLKFLTKVLNIKINENKISISKNNLNIPFTLIYKVNNRIKKVNIKETV